MKNTYEARGDVTAIFMNRKDGSRLETIVDTELLEKVSSYNGTWFAYYDKFTKTYYVRGNDRETNGKRTVLLLHRFIMDTPEGLVVDHLNHDTLNNTHENLRNVTRLQNGQNLKQRQEKSSLRGVSWIRRHSKWRVQLHVAGKWIYCGLYSSQQEAETVAIESRKQHMPYAVEGAVIW